MSTFRCISCNSDCCGCNGCREMVTPKGTRCCSRCFVGVCRTEDSVVQSAQYFGTGTPQALQNSVQRILQDRPNEKLYVN